MLSAARRVRLPPPPAASTKTLVGGAGGNVGFRTDGPGVAAYLADLVMRVLRLFLHLRDLIEVI